MLITWWNSATYYKDQHINQQQYNIQHAHSHANYFGISVYVFNASLFESNNIFLYDLCQIMVFILHQFLANIYTFITHAIAQVFNFDTLLIYRLSLPGFIFSNHIPISCTSIIAIHESNFFSHMWYSNTNISFETKLYPHTITINLFHVVTATRKHHQL